MAFLSTEHSNSHYFKMHSQTGHLIFIISFKNLYVWPRKPTNMHSVYMYFILFLIVYFILLCYNSSCTFRHVRYPDFAFVIVIYTPSYVSFVN
jgi:hypothetical protein